MLFRKTMIKRYRNSEACGRSLAWSRTSACHADDPGSNPGGRTTTEEKQINRSQSEIKMRAPVV